MTERTPGPWYAQMPADSNGYAHVSTSPNLLLGGDIATTWPKGDDGYTAFANARLLAAAPDLYEALNGLVGLCALLLANDLPANVRDALENNHRVKAAHEALAKAESPSIKEQMGKV